MQKIITCLVIDDDPEDHEIFQMAIQETSLQVNCIFTSDCHNAMQCLREVNISIPDFLFIDWNLTTMNGPECLFHLNQVPIANSQVIFYSGSLPLTANPGLAQNQSFLRKSNSISQFAQELKMILEKSN